MLCPALLFCLWITACATTSAPVPLGDAELTAQAYSGQFNFLDVYDPFESLNRRIYKFNAKFDQYVFLPAINAYRFITPKFFRAGVSNFFSNLNEVPVLANSILQIKPQSSLVTLGRFIINTTVGIGGLWNPATKLGLDKKNEDLGQTLGHYRVASGPYLVLPILGPSNLRDGAGMVGDRLFRGQVNPLYFDETASTHVALYGVESLNLRYLNPFRYGQFGSPFEYDLIRYFYTKQREFLIAQ